MLGITVALCSAGVPAGAQEDLPPPPIAPVLPAVPNVAPGYAAPANAPLPTGDLVGVTQQPFVGIQFKTRSRWRCNAIPISPSPSRTTASRTTRSWPPRAPTTWRSCSQPQYPHSVSRADVVELAGPAGGPITQISNGVSAAFAGNTTPVDATASARVSSDPATTPLEHLQPVLQHGDRAQLVAAAVARSRRGQPCAVS